MAVPRTVATVTAGLCLFGASGVLLQRALDEPAPNDRLAPVSTASAPLPPGEVEVRAADRAVLVRLCLEGLHDPAMGVYYRAAAAAQPALAAGIRADCSLAPPAP